VTTLVGPRTRSNGAAPRRWRDGGFRHVHAGPIALRVDSRAVLVSVVLFAVVFVGGCWSISVGDFPVPFGDVVREVTGIGGTTDSEFIVQVLRLPRVLTGLLVGAAFGISGQVFQRLSRNPLASPDIIGVTSGAAFGAVLCIVSISTVTASVTTGALVGSFATVALLYVLAVRDGLSSYRLVLVGIGLTTMLDAAVAYLMTRAQLHDAQRAITWLTGSLNGRSWEYVRPLTIALVILVPVTMAASRQLRVMEMGDDCAAGLGVSLRRSRAALALCGAALAAVATAATGPVAFVALAAPQIARRLVGERSAGIVPAALVGSAMVVLGDLVARNAFGGVELPVGIVTAMVGAPYLLWLLTRANRIGRAG
jgi:iron complex transport system permease protein